MNEQPLLEYGATVGDALKYAAKKYGARDFIVLPDRRITFAEVEVSSRLLAKRMLAAGIGKGTRVGLLYTYGPEFCIVWFAVLRIGAIAMPLSTIYKPAELGKVVRAGDIQLLVVPPSLLGRNIEATLIASAPSLEEADGGTLFLDELPFLRHIWVTGQVEHAWATSVPFDGTGPFEVSDELFEKVEQAVVPADLAQVTYTSGSSAEPKGVLHSHGAIVRNTSPAAAEWAVRSVGLEWPIRSVFCGFPFFWIGGTLVIGQALQAGWTISCVERFEAAAALDIIERERPERIMAWPSLIQSMRTHPSLAARDVSWLKGLRPPTEGTPHQMPGPTRHRGMSETMGNWFGVESKVVDPDTGESVIDGSEGELLVRGWAVTQGYYKKEREEVFGPDGWFHTGDRVFRSDGSNWFVGRFAELIKSQGANVSPREIEVLLESYPGVQHAIVLGLPHPELEEEVVAVIVPAPGSVLNSVDLQGLVRRDLSSYKVPTQIHIVSKEDDVPWLATGKPDKLRLRAQLLQSNSP